MSRKAYPSDLTDLQWTLIKELLPEPKTSPKGGRPRSIDLREVVNAILYLARAGCQWDMLPHDLPAKSTVYEYFSAWRDDGTLDAVNRTLLGAVRGLEAPSGEIEPSAASVDSQTVKSTERCSTRGYDGGKKIRGRKRHVAVDTLGLLLAVAVTVASTDDAEGARLVMAELTQQHQPRLEVVWADSKYHNHALHAWLETQAIGWRLEIVRREPGAQGFVLLPKRWVVERTFGWLGRWRRLARDNEHYERSSVAMIHVASIGRMLRRLDPPEDMPPFKYRASA